MLGYVCDARKAFCDGSVNEKGRIGSYSHHESRLTNRGRSTSGQGHRRADAGPRSMSRSPLAPHAMGAASVLRGVMMAVGHRRSALPCEMQQGTLFDHVHVYIYTID